MGKTFLAICIIIIPRRSDIMNIIKTGKFIADIRREAGLTQQELGERIGVTNKTVSRWETGTYMPPIESLEMLSKTLGVSINEIIAGERLTPEEFVAKAEENIVSAWQDSSFTLRERQEYFKKRWQRSHVFHVVLLILFTIALFTLGHFFAGWLAVAAYIVGFGGTVLLYNSMMAYVERKAFENPNNDGNKEK